MNVCAFGYFDLEGQRSRVIREGLKGAGHTVTLCRTEAKGFWPKMRALTTQWRTIRRTSDALYVVFPGHYLMPLAWFLGWRKRIPVILDVFISLYETEVEDRARIGRWHPKAWLLALIDRLACSLATIILIDTEEHREYFVRRYRIPPEKFLVIPVGCRTDLFFPANGDSSTTRNLQPAVRGPEAFRPEWETCNHPFSIRFHGSFIPLHGIETILRAAKELTSDGVEFRVLGRGQTYPAMRALAEELRLGNVRFVDPIPLRELPRFITDADCCLGIFGTGGKAQRVIPTKVFEILACGKPLITARTPAVARALRDREHALLTTPGDPHDLAAKIRELMANPALARSIAENGHRLFLECFQPKSVVEPLAEWLSHRR